MQTTHDQRSVGELFGELTREMSTLVRQEVQLAKTEMCQKAAVVGKHSAFIGAGAALAYGGLLALLAALALLLRGLMPLWLSATLVGFLAVGVGYFLVQKGLTALKTTDLAPRETIQTIKEDTQWAKHQLA